MSAKFIVLTTQRSGSTWFLDVLNHQRGVAGHQELFYQKARQKPGTAGCNDYPRYVELYRNKRLLRPLYVFSYLNGLYKRDDAIGFKLMYTHLRIYPEILLYLTFRSIKVIHLIRRNRLDVIISEEMAKVTGHSHLVAGQHRGENVKIHLDTTNLLERISMLNKKIEHARKLLRFLFCPVFEVYYEDLLKNNSEFVKVCNFLKIDSQNILVESNLVKRRNCGYTEIIENYDQVFHLLKETPYSYLLQENN